VIQLKNETIYDQISEITRQVPNKIAIQQGDRSLSYIMLERDSNQLANLLATNIEKNKNIVTILENGIELVQAAVGIMKAGCVFVPVDSNYPDNRIRMMIEKVGTSWIVTTSHHFDKLQRLFGQELQHIRIILIDGKEFELIDANIKAYYLKDYSDTAMIWERNPYSYIYFTSGSTGAPKAILGRHRSLKHFIDWEIREFQIDNNCIGSQFTSPSFDPFLRDIFVPLCAGGTVCIPENRGLLFSSQALKQWISTNKITLIHIIPTLFRVLMEEVSSASSFPSLKYVLLAGELLRGQDVKKFLNIFENRIHLINLYGPSETTLAKVYYRIQPDDEKRLTIPIGKPIDNTQILILDTGMQPIPMGSIGEIYIRTPYISAGYYKDKDLNKEVFIKNPFNSNKNDILYKTGDKGRLLASDDFEIIGRMDNQVKINGIRIEPEEIENRLIRYSDIKQAVIVAHENDLGDKYLSAYIVSDEDVSSNELRQRLLESLPDYMIPLYFVRMDKFPLTPNGKVNRQALLAPKCEVHVEYVAPRNTTEEMLTRIWRETLNKNKIGIYDNFFELGGNSLRGTVLVTRIHKELSVEVPLKELFRMPTIAGISEYLLEAKESSYANIESAETKEYYEVSSAQKRMWLLNQFDPDSVGYNIPNVINLEGNLDKCGLKHALQSLIDRHEVLRTSFEIIGDEVVQRIAEKVEFEIDCFENSEVEIDELIKAFIRPFDLGKAPLLRLGLIKVSENKYYLMFDIHHIISDGVSMSILTRELMALYDRQELEEQYIQYKDFSEWQNEYLKSEKMQEQEEYWLKQFSDEIPLLNFPLDYTRPSVQSFKGASVEFRLNHRRTEELNNLAREAGATLYMVLLSVINILLSKYTEQEDIIVGSPIAGRPHTDLENIIGMFVNTLVMRNYPISSKTYEEFLKEVKEVALGAYENQDYQFESLVDKLNLRRDLSRSPLFDVMFVLQNVETRESMIADLELTKYDTDQTLAKFDLTFIAIENKGEILFNIEYCTNLFKRETIKRLSMHLQNLIETITKDKGIYLGEIDIMSVDERNKILHEFNDTYVEYPRDKTIHQLFEEQVEKTPNNIALVFNDKRMTYRELNEKSNQVARRLRANSVKVDDIVGIMVDRSFEMIIGILGILKSGGAYLPIDPDYPEERIKFMLEDSGAEVLLIQSWLNERVVLDREWCNCYLDKMPWMEEGYASDKENLQLVNTPKHLAYVIYTSGSTGNPKGVLVEHGNVANLAIGQKNKYKMDEYDRVVQLHSISFDPFIEQMFIALLSGASLYLINDDILFDKFKLNTFLRSNAITHLDAAPSFLEWTDLSELEHLKRVVGGGEVFSVNLAKKLNVQAIIYNEYGPTETTITSLMYQVKSKELDSSIPIGSPITNYQAYILNNNKCSPIGVPGELHIGGKGVVRGYLNRPELTEEKFIDNPFISGERIYRTGDLARWLPDGNIEFLGRIDQQVKIRGFRIELGEIESQLLKLNDVKEAVVLAGEDETEDKYLCAYVVLEGEVSTNQLRVQLSNSLPNYMIPSYFVRLEKIPLLPNGKVDRKALPKPEGNASMEYIVPSTGEEEIVARAFEEILNIENVGAMDDFFALGGDSIKAIRIISKLREKGYELSVQDLMRNSVVTSASEKLKKRKEDVLYEQGDVIGELSFTPIQKWFFASDLIKKRSHFNQAIILKITERINRDGIVAVLEMIVKHHDILRVVYRNGKQELLASDINVGYEMNEYDYRDDKLNKIELAKKIEDKNNELHASINIETGPLMKVGLFRTEEMDHLMVCIHHLAVDGVSWRILMEDLESGYRQYLAGIKIKFSEKTASFKAWSEALNDYSTSDELKQETAYWIRIAEKISKGNIPIMATEGAGVGKTNVTLSVEETDKLLYQSSKAFGTEINDLLLSGLGLAIQSLTGQEKVSVNLEGHGREAIHKRIDIDRTMGWFTSIYPISIEVNNDIKEMIIKTKEMLRKIPNKGLGYGVLKYLTGLGFEHGEAQVLFNYLGSIDTDIGVRNSIFQASEYSSGRAVSLENTASEILDINCIVFEGKMKINISYRRDRLSDEDAKQFGAFFIEALRDVMNACMEQEGVIKTSSDFGLSDESMSQADLEKLLKLF